MSILRAKVTQDYHPSFGFLDGGFLSCNAIRCTCGYRSRLVHGPAGTGPWGSSTHAKTLAAAIAVRNRTLSLCLRRLAPSDSIHETVAGGLLPCKQDEISDPSQFLTSGKRRIVNMQGQEKIQSM